MKNEIVVNVESSEIAIALLENKNLVELNKEERDFSFNVGDLYLGKVKKIMPGLNAAFIDIGYDRDAFLHYFDLGSNFQTLNHFVKNIKKHKKPLSTQKTKLEKELEKEGLISKVLHTGEDILVQITKEPISTKGPRLTSEISIAGRYLVLMPFLNKVSISQKIRSPEERSRLRKLIQSVKPKNYGVIVRTVAEGKKVAELDSELKVLIKRWEDAVGKIAKKQAPSLILNEIGRTVGLLRDVFNADFEAIHINEEEAYKEVLDYITLISSEQKRIVKLYKKNIPIFDHFNITKQLKSSFGKVVTIRNGAYLVIEHTEALHVIDVNSGNRSRSNSGQEGNALEVNLSAAEEIARQLRLRDMGGIIVIDFIDLQEANNRQLLFEKMQEHMRSDRAKHNILPLSKFGLMQITRQRVRPEIHVETEEVCPTCQGKEKIESSILFIDTLENKVKNTINHLKIKDFTLQVHPFVYAYLNKGLFSIKKKWKLQYSSSLKIIANQNFSLMQYKLIDSKKKEINSKKKNKK